MNLFVIAFLALGMIWAFGGAWSSDAMIRELYDSHRAEWVAMGRPSTSFRPPPGSVQQSRWETQKLMWSWSMRPPEWTGASRKARAAITVMRLSFMAMFADLALMLAIIVWLA